MSFFSTDDELAAAITDVCKKARIELPCARSLAGSVFDAMKLRHHSAKYRDRFHWHKTHDRHWTIFGINESGRIVVTGDPDGLCSTNKAFPSNDLGLF